MVSATVEKPAWLKVRAAAEIMDRSPDVVRRYIRDGVTSRSGFTVKLRAALVGGQWATSAEWIADFIVACGGNAEPVQAETPAAAERRGKREQKAAKKALGGK